ncbi:MAG: HEAT repeat domain-containing protein [Planctomycetota bacterium]
MLPRAFVLTCFAVLPIFLSACGGGSFGYRGADPDATSFFSGVGPVTPQQAAAWAVDPYNADNRFRGISLLSRAPFGGGPEYVALYRRALADGDATVRAAAVRGLAAHGTAGDVAGIVALLQGNTTVQLRWEIARALQRLHDPDHAIDPLLELMFEENEENLDVRINAARALGQYPQRRVLDALIAALRERDLGVNDAAKQSLVDLTGQDFGLDQSEWLAFADRTDNPFVRQQLYEYPIFWRGRLWYEWLLIWRRPPNEVASTPIGMPALVPEAE